MYDKQLKLRDKYDTIYYINGIFSVCPLIKYCEPMGLYIFYGEEITWYHKNTEENFTRLSLC